MSEDGSFFKKLFKQEDLNKVADGASLRDPNDPPLTIGDIVRLNSGSPLLVIVDITETEVTCINPMNKWGYEYVLNEPMVYRAKKIDRQYDAAMIHAINFEKYVDNINAKTLYRNYLKRCKKT